MLQEGHRIEDSKASPLIVKVASETQQQSTQQKTKPKSNSDNNKLGWLNAAGPGQKVASSGEPKDVEGRSAEALGSESDDGLEEGGLEASYLDTSTKSREVSAPATVPNVRVLPYQDSSYSKPVAHRIDSNKKLERQIRNVQKAIQQESSRPGKSNAGILKGLKKALEKLIATRNHQNKLPLSQSPEFQNRSGSPEKKSGVKSLFQPEPIQTVAPPETQQSPQDGEVIRLQADKPINEERLATVLASTPRLSLADAEPTKPRDLTPENDLTMAESNASGGEKWHEGQGLALVDHDMTDAEATVANFFPLTEQCHHYVRRSDVSWDIQK